MGLYDKSGSEQTQLMEVAAVNESTSTPAREESAFMPGLSSHSARYGIDIRGFRLHREAQDLGTVLATLDGIQGRISIVDRQTNRVIHGTADDIMQRVAGMLPPESKD